MARERLSGDRFLTGRAEDYTDPVGAIGYQLVMLLRDYAEQGGDLENVQLTVGTEQATHDRVSRRVARVRLDGWTP